ncbi:MAG: hypothetical protein LBD60_03245 [Puniceicoccales bacterium]|jgi:hypothetical protein|nr:hypothetical protein [Puniceicoccales bacterium]
MIYKKQFHQLPYNTKRKTVFRFLLLFFLEFLANKLFIQYGLSVIIFPFFWLIFAKKYFNFHIGLGLFSIGFVFYFCFYYLTFLQLLFTAIAMFYGAHLTDIDKFSAFLTLLIQNLLFTFFDFDFNSSALIQSFLLSLLCIALVNIDLVSTNARQHETVFL